MVTNGTNLHSSSQVQNNVAQNDRHVTGDRVETVLFKQAGVTPLYADIYMPEQSQITQVKRPIGTRYLLATIRGDTNIF